MGWAETRAFLSKVVPWPGDDPGYANLHYSITNREQGGRDIVTGKPFRNLDQFVGFADWAVKNDNIKEVWYCTSLQKEAGETKAGKPKAIRNQINTQALKAIWIDIDVKDDEKNYKSIEEAWAAFIELRREEGLPTPSAVVKSGGGMHIYWISVKALTPEEWAPYAHGLKNLLLKHKLKCDAGLTTDSARLLRVPSTLNYKYDPPRPVELLPIPLKEYDFEEQLGFLRDLAPVRIENGLPSAFAGRKPIFTGIDKLGGGVDRPEMPPLPIAPIAKGCAFIRDALETGGKDYGQPLWNLTTLAATFLEDGHDLAHKMGRQHPAYSFESTEDLWGRKLRERANNGLGWPSCAAIQASGCQSCDGCPHLPSGKSPLHLALPDKREEAKASDLPKGYIRNKDNIICKVETKVTKEGEEITLVHPLFFCELDTFWAQKSAGADNVHFRMSHDKDNYITGHISLADICGGQIGNVLAKQHVKINPENKRFLEGFFVSLLAELHKAMQAQESYPFGWMTQGELTKGFIYGGQVFYDDGTVKPAGVSDEHLSQWYKPTGSKAAWMQACETVTGLQRPELNTIIAIAFASPLLTMTGQKGLTINAWGDSGSGKSSAMEVGISVWGDPVKAKEDAHTTKNSLMNKMGTLRALPSFWDEITTPEVQRQAVATSFGQTGGVEKGRMTVNIKQRDRGTWKCILGMSANVSLVDVVVKTQPGHAGGINRILEYHVDKNDPAKLISPSDADRIFGSLDYNYGMIGLEYAKFLALNHKQISIELLERRKKIETDLKATQEERFWTAGLATLLCGADYANRLGCSFDLEALERFLYATFRANRDRRSAEGIMGGTLENTDDVLAAYLKARATLNTLWVSGISEKAGRKAAVTLLHGPPANSNVRDGISVVWDVPHRKLRISRKDFRKWLDDEEIPATPVTRGMKSHYGMDVQKLVIAGGTSYKTLQEHVIILSVPPNSAMEDMMVQYNPAP